MRKVFSTLVAVALLGGAITVASAQERRGRDRDDEFGPASAQETQRGRCLMSGAPFSVFA